MCIILAFATWVPSAYAGQLPRHNLVQYGVASWYGERNQGRLMACGEPYNEYAMVAAHRTLPLGTKVEVTNLRNGRSVVVRVLDRGPYIAGRAIDLSLAAARRLRFANRGLAPVKIRVLRTPQHLAPQAELENPPQFTLHRRRNVAAGMPLLTNSLNSPLSSIPMCPSWGSCPILL